MHVTHTSTVPSLDELKDAFKSAKLVYRPMEDNAEDKEFFQKEIWSDPLAMGFGGRSILRPISKQKCDDQLKEILSSKSWLACVPCLPALGGGGKPTPIGFLLLSNSSTEQIRIGTLAICVSSNYQNQGYGTEILRWAINWGFSFANLHRLQLETKSFNSRAIHLYKRLGFTEEGRRRQVGFIANQYYDLVDMSILRPEWLSNGRAV